MTCAAIRLVHLELMLDLSLETLIRCLRCFKSRRGTPQSFISDNAIAFREKERNTFLAKNEIQWRLNLPRAQSWGGLFEMMIMQLRDAFVNTNELSEQHMKIF